MHADSHETIDCPVCGRPLIPLAVGRVVVDVCHHGCGGIWFDHFELQRFDEHHEGEGKTLAHVERDPAVTRDPARRLHCPRCREVVLRKHFFSVKQQVEVDSCPGCGGYWLDHGELALVRSEFATAEARRRAAQKFIEDLDDRHVAKPCPEKYAKAERAASLSAMFVLVGSRYV
jgi:Zn-finger nucleic acid-binding protein